MRHIFLKMCMCGSDRDTWKHKPVKKEDSKRKDGTFVINNKMGGGGRHSIIFWTTFSFHIFMHVRNVITFMISRQSCINFSPTSCFDDKRLRLTPMSGNEASCSLKHSFTFEPDRVTWPHCFWPPNVAEPRSGLLKQPQIITLPSRGCTVHNRHDRCITSFTSPRCFHHSGAG